MLDKFTKSISHIIDILELKDINSIFLKLGILLLGFFAPLHQMLFSLLFLVLTDFITGILAAIKKKQTITSSKLSRTVSKILVYLTTVTVVHVANDYLLFGSDYIPLESFVVSFIAITELKSIFENLNKISRQRFLSNIIWKLSNDGRKQKKDRIK